MKKTIKNIFGLSVLSVCILPSQAQTVEKGLESLVKVKSIPTVKASLSSLSSAQITKDLLYHTNLNRLPEEKNYLLSKVQQRVGNTSLGVRQIPVSPLLNMKANTAAAKAVAVGEKDLKKLDFNNKFWKRDPSLWKEDAGSQAFITQFLGWQKVYEFTLAHMGEINAFARDVQRNFDYCVVMGMGGSSLAPEVFRQVFGKQAGWPELIVLDTTNPDLIATTRARIDPSRTLFIFASKSGGTVEPASQFAYFYDEVKSAGVAEPGSHFVAITDANTGLEALAAEKKFRKVFINPSDVGGRFSALSFFGIVPAAVMGVDVERLLVTAQRESFFFGPEVPFKSNVALNLGAFMGANVQFLGRDKMTLLTAQPLQSLGLWVEQLVAESTGKEGKGIVPVAGEPIRFSFDYMKDRFFVQIHTHTTADGTVTHLANELTQRGYPVFTIDMRDPYQLGSMFLTWEIATAAAGAEMKINPFDQPNVQAAKDMTKGLLKQLQAGQVPPEIQAPVLVSAALEDEVDPADFRVEDLYAQIQEGDYIALLPYVEPTEKTDAAFAALRSKIMQNTGHAVLFGYGPRYLHSTGQLHKGDGNNGVFIIISADPVTDVKIPGQPYTFGQLSNSQALGDFKALENNGRRAIRIHLDASVPVDEAIRNLSRLF